MLIARKKYCKSKFVDQDGVRVSEGRSRGSGRGRFSGAYTVRFLFVVEVNLPWRISIASGLKFLAVQVRARLCSARAVIQTSLAESAFIARIPSPTIKSGQAEWV
jgi:hypothetical protein